jgi:hypothetical protein
MMRRTLTAGLGSLTIAVAVFCVLSGPSANRLQAIPVHAHLVYNSASPDWFLSFFPMFGKNGDEFSKVWKKSFQPLEKRPLAVATVAFAGPQQRNSWVAVSELDGFSALALRWRLMLFPPEGIRPARSYAAWPVWRFEHPDLPSWAKVRFAVTENLLVCSISADSHDMYRLLDTADGRAASKAR